MNIHVNTVSSILYKMENTPCDQDQALNTLGSP